MIVGPSRTFFMDEVSNGLDSSTTSQIISVLQHSVHIMETTLLVSLLQPAPEIFNLFDEIILMAEGRIIYHGPRDRVFEFFENCGFKCPERKSPADFLHEACASCHCKFLLCFILFLVFIGVAQLLFCSGDFEEGSSTVLVSLKSALSSYFCWEICRIIQGTLPR